MADWQGRAGREAGNPRAYYPRSTPKPPPQRRRSKLDWQGNQSTRTKALSGATGGFLLLGLILGGWAWFLLAGIAFIAMLTTWNQK